MTSQGQKIEVSENIVRALLPANYIVLICLALGFSVSIYGTGTPKLHSIQTQKSTPHSVCHRFEV